jgi:hypothetical protein
MLRAVGSGKSWPEQQRADGRGSSPPADRRGSPPAERHEPAGSVLERGEGRRQARVTHLHFEQEPSAVCENFVRLQNQRDTVRLRTIVNWYGSEAPKASLIRAPINRGSEDLR